jgi:hypothetical protein
MSRPFALWEGWVDSLSSLPSSLVGQRETSLSIIPILVLRGESLERPINWLDVLLGEGRLAHGAPSVERRHLIAEG